MKPSIWKLEGYLAQLTGNRKFTSSRWFRDFYNGVLHKSSHCQISCISSRKRSKVIETCRKWSNLLKLNQFELTKPCQNKYRLNEAATTGTGGRCRLTLFFGFPFNLWTNFMRDCRLLLKNPRAKTSENSKHGLKNHKPKRPVRIRFSDFAMIQASHAPRKSRVRQFRDVSQRSSNRNVSLLSWDVQTKVRNLPWIGIIPSQICSNSIEKPWNFLRGFAPEPR